MSTHRLDTELLFARVSAFVQGESEGPWWMTSNTMNGIWRTASFPAEYNPTANKRMYVQDVCKALNGRASNGGAWLVGWINRGRTLFLIWKDEDGDIQAVNECDKPWHLIKNWQPDDWVKQGHTMVAQWEQTMGAISRAGKRPTIKIAQAIPNPSTPIDNNFKH